MSYNHQRFAYFTKDSSFLEKKDQLDSNCITFREENKSIYVNGHDFGEPYDDSSILKKVDTKQNVLISGTNIKTINNQSILGSGNINIQGGSGSSDYNDLTNKPSINSVTLSGDKSLSDLGINIPTSLSQLSDDSTHRLVTDNEKNNWNSKQDAISNLNTIISNAAAGKTASDNLAGHTVGINVPSNAKFTDTVYDDTAVKSRLTNIENQETYWNGKQNAISDLDTIRRNASNVPFIIQHIPASGTYILNGTANHTYQYMIFNGTTDYSTLNVQLASDSATNSVDGWQHYLLIYNNTGHNLNIVIGRGMASTKSIATVGHAQQIELAWMVHYETNKYNYILTISDVMTWLS